MITAVFRQMAVWFGLMGLVLAAQPGWAADGETLRTIQARGFVLCGSSSSVGADWQDSNGEWVGFGADLCRAIAAATMGNARATQTVIVDGQLRFEGLVAHEFDVLLAQATWTMGREASWPILFTNVMMHDGQGFLSHQADKATTPVLLSTPQTICVMEGTTSEYHLRDEIVKKRLEWKIMAYQSLDPRNLAFINRRCSLLSSDRSELAAFAAYRPNIRFRLDPLVLTDEPTGPVVRDDDVHWFELVRWSMFALIAAEAEGLSRDTIVAQRQIGEGSEQRRRLLGLEPGFGKPLGLPDDWAFQIIRQVGNYAEIWDRNLGAASVLKIPRGQNRLVRDGGLIFAPSFR